MDCFIYEVMPMMNEAKFLFQGQELIPLAQVPNLLPRTRDKKVHIRTIVRWITRGLKSPQGGTQKLETIRIGGRIFVTGDGLRRFFTERRTAYVPPFSVPQPNSPH